MARHFQAKPYNRYAVGVLHSVYRCHYSCAAAGCLEVHDASQSCVTVLQPDWSLGPGLPESSLTIASCLRTHARSQPPLSAAHRRSRASFGRFLHSSSRSQTSSNICHADTRDESVAVAHPISTRCQCLEARHSTGFSLRGSNRFEVIKRSHPQDCSINLFTPVSTLFTSTVTVYKVYTL